MTGWEGDALCAQTDPDMFSPENGHSDRDAKKVCDDCTVRAKCLAWALETNQEWGVLGGLNAKERRALVNA